MSLPDTVPEVLERLRGIERDLPRTDGAAVFNRVYLQVTELVAAELEEAGGFEDLAFMAELDVRFANLWLAAHDAAAAGDRVPAAWKPLFEARERPGLLPIQFALAGMNAHIENDLPLAVVETCRARGVTPREPFVHRDFEAVNDLLARVESEIRRSFLTEVGQRLDEHVGALLHLVSAWKIDKARELAWVNVETLWATASLGPLHQRYVDVLEQTVGMTSRYLLTPVWGGLPPR